MRSRVRRFLGRTRLGVVLAILLHPTRAANHRRNLAASNCSFCRRGYPEVERLIAGPDGVAICNRCIRLGEQILMEEGVR